MNLKNIRTLLLREAFYETFDKEDVLGRQRFRLFAIFSLTGSVVSMAVFLKMYIMFNHLNVLHVVLPLLSCVMLVNYFRLQSNVSPERAYYIVLLAAFLLLHIVSYSTGGIRSASIIYHSVVILYAFMLLGKKGGKEFSLLFGAQVIYIFLISRYTSLTSFEFLQNQTEHIEEDFLFNALFSFFLITTHSSYLNSGRNIVLQKVTEQRDLLERKNNQLQKVNQTLENANRELGKFAYVVSHDLKAPLRAIGNLSGMIREDIAEGNTEKTSAQLDIIEQRVARMEALIEGILKYSKVTLTEEQYQFFNLKELILNTTDMLNAREICTVNITGPTSIKSSPQKIQHIFLQLIDNALRHNTNSNKLVSIDIMLYEEHLHCSVKDNGPGIEKQYHEKVFVIFQTLLPRDESENTGIGLSIVKRIIDDMGGKIWIQSENNSGTTFHFTWPIIHTKQEPTQKAEFVF